jgi:hypothetical protein
MPAQSTFAKVVAKGVLLAALTSLVVSLPLESASAAKRRYAAAPGACRVSHHRMVANGGNCAVGCNALGWCANMLCTNGQLTQLPLLCHSPEACPATRC